MAGFAGVRIGSAVYGKSSPTTCEVTYDPRWIGRESCHRGFSDEARTPIQDFLGISEQSLFSDITFAYNLSPKIYENTEKSTRSFTSLGGYNSPKKSFLEDAGGRKRAFTSPWETRSPSHHSRTYSEFVEPYSRESTCLSPNVEFVPTIDHSKLRWVDALNCWVPDRRPSQAFVTFVHGAPVRQRTLSPTNQDSIRAQLSLSHDTYCGPPGVKTHRHQSAWTYRGPDPGRRNHQDGQKNNQIRRSHTITISKDITNKSRVSFFPQSRRQSRSSTASNPPNPPPSMTPSANSTRSFPVPFQRLNSGEGTLPPAVSQVTNKEDRLQAPTIFPKVDCEVASDKSVSVVEVDEGVISSRGRMIHSRQGSSSSILTDLHSTPLSTHSQDVLEQKTIEASQQRAITPVSHPRDTTLSSPKLFLAVPSQTNCITDQKSYTSEKKSPAVKIPKSSVEPLPRSNDTIDSPHERQRKKAPVESSGNVMEDKIVSKQNGYQYRRISFDKEVHQILDPPVQNGFHEADLTKQTVSKAPVREITPLLATIEEKDSSTDLTNNLNVQEEKKLNSEKISMKSITSAHSLKRKPIVKKVRKEKSVQKSVEEKVVQKEKTPSPALLPVESRLSNNKSDSDSDIEEIWFGAETGPVKVNSSDLQVTLPDMSLPSIPVKTTESKTNVRNQMSLPDVTKKEKKSRRRKSSLKSSSYKEEQRLQELGEDRRRRQQAMLEQHKLKSNRRSSILTDKRDDSESAPRFEDYDFLAKYCIFDNGTYQSYKEAFDAIDTEKLWLSRTQVLSALKNLNTNLSQLEDAYLKQILELLGYNVSNGADFKLFSVIAALSRRISALDSWMKTVIGNLDFKTLEIKLYIWKTLWECNVDKDSNTISLDQLCVELRAGGVSEKHVRDVSQKLGHLTRLDLLDFLTYIPLFVMIHEAVVHNPLNDRRET